MAKVLCVEEERQAQVGRLSLGESTVTLDAKSSSDLEWLSQICSAQCNHPGFRGDGDG